MIDDVTLAAHLPPWLSNLIVYGFGVLGPLALVAVAAQRAVAFHRRAAQARAAHDTEQALAEGEAIVSGTVEYDAEQPGAIEIEITEEGTEHHAPAGTIHSWTEVDRRVQVRPFYLRRAEGERIRVEPNERTRLVDEIDGCRLVGANQRICTVKLSPGERVLATGVLRRTADPSAPVAGYRDAPMSWTFVDSPRAPLFLSTRPLDERLTRWRRLHLRWLAVFALALTGAQIVLLGHHARVLAGEIAWAEVTNRDHTVKPGAWNEDRHYRAMTAELPWGDVVVQDVDATSFERAPFGSRVPVQHLHHWFAQYGRHSTIHFAVGAGVVGGFIALVLLYAAAIHRARPWYTEPTVSRGKGPLDPKTGLRGRARWQVSMGRAHAVDSGVPDGP